MAKSKFTLLRGLGDKSFFTKASLRKRYKDMTSFIKSRPLTSFFIALLLLFVLILLGSFINKPKAQPPTTASVKTVHTYIIGESPKATFQAKIDKSGVIKVVALAPGVVQDIFVSEGDYVGQGQQIVTMSTNYQGGNAPALQAQIAQEQYKNTADTYNDQKDVIQKQRDIANKTSDNASLMRDITSQSVNDSNNLINANQNVLDTLHANLTQLESTNVGGANDSAILSAKELINQLQGGQDQLRASVRSLDAQSQVDKPQNQLQGLQKDVTLKQLDLQMKALTMSKEVSKLQADMAWVNAATMYPASPFEGTVQKIYVRLGQQVNPGTPIAEISSSDQHVTAVALVPEYIAKNMSILESSDLFIRNTRYSVRPLFISSEATDGLLYSVIYTVDSDLPVTDGEYIKINIPVGTPNTGAAVPFVPIDSVYQTQEKAYLMVINNHKAVTREVVLGSIFGSYVEIVQGLKSGDQVILDRNVVDGDTVKTN